jgi:hypothetical protein
MLDKQNNLKANFPNFINVLGANGGLPNLHVGVVTSDLGTRSTLDAQPGPGIGTGAGACLGTGKAGNLHGNAAITGSYISDVKAADGSRAINYTGTLAEAFSAVASVGAGGCGFEQSIEAARLALDSNPNNAGFLRAGAGLAIVVLSDEDDCSLAHTALLGTDTTTYGPLQSFRCTRFGVTCDVSGQTTDQMNTVGVKGSCHSNESLADLTRIADYATFFKGLKNSQQNVMFGAIVGPTSPFDIELRSPPGGGTGIPALGHSCQYVDGVGGTQVADPAVRIAQLAGQFSNSTLSTVCQQDLSAPLTALASWATNLASDPCLATAIAQPADCEVFDVLGTTETPVPACSGATTTDCYTLVEDAVACPARPQHLRLQIDRSTTPSNDLVVSVRCTVP